MVMSNRNGTLPPGWAVRVNRDSAGDRYLTTFVYAARLASPAEAVRRVCERFGFDERLNEVETIGVLSVKTLDDAGVPPDDVAGPL